MHDDTTPPDGYKGTLTHNFIWIIIGGVLIFIVFQDVPSTILMMQMLLAVIFFLRIFVTIKTEKRLIRSDGFWRCLFEAFAWAVLAGFWALSLTAVGNLFLSEAGGSVIATQIPPEQRNPIAVIAHFQSLYSISELLRIFGRDLAVFCVDVFALVFCTAYFRDKGFLQHTANSDTIILIATALAILCADAVLDLSFAGFASFQILEMVQAVFGHIQARVLNLVTLFRENGLSVSAYWVYLSDRYFAGQGDLLFLTKSLPAVLLIFAVTQINLRRRPIETQDRAPQASANPYAMRTIVIFALYPAALILVLGFRTMLHAFDPPTQPGMDAIWYLLVPYKLFVTVGILIPWGIVLIGPVYASQRMMRFARPFKAAPEPQR